MLENLSSNNLILLKKAIEETLRKRYTICNLPFDIINFHILPYLNNVEKINFLTTIYNKENENLKQVLIECQLLYIVQQNVYYIAEKFIYYCAPSNDVLKCFIFGNWSVFSFKKRHKMIQSMQPMALLNIHSQYPHLRVHFFQQNLEKQVRDCIKRESMQMRITAHMVTPYHNISNSVWKMNNHYYNFNTIPNDTVIADATNFSYDMIK